MKYSQSNALPKIYAVTFSRIDAESLDQLLSPENQKVILIEEQRIEKPSSDIEKLIVEALPGI